MKLRSVFVVMSAALIGVTSAGFAQAAPRDGHRYYSGDRHSGHHGYQRSYRNGLGVALGLGLIGAAIASQAYSQPYYGYAPVYPATPYGYAPGYYGNYGYQYSQPWNYGYAQPGYSQYPNGP